jgi:DNA-binding XRE family transcriptional regulator
MTKSLNELRKKINPEVQTAARAKAVDIIAKMSLAEARKARGKNQSILAKCLKIAQPNISQIENRPDALISTLSQYIEALGGKLEIHAKFPDGQDIEIVQFNS